MDPDIRQEFKRNDLPIVDLLEVIPNESNVIHSMDPDIHQEFKGNSLGIAAVVECYSQQLTNAESLTAA